MKSAVRNGRIVVLGMDVDGSMQVAIAFWAIALQQPSGDRIDFEIKP
jgi:hypothetical protein